MSIEKRGSMIFRKGIPKNMDPAAIQRGINETLTNVVRGAITRCAGVDKMKAALYAGAIPLCIVASNDTTSGLRLRAVSHTLDNRQIISYPLADFDPDYQVADLVFYSARKPDGTLNELIVGPVEHPLLERLKEVVSNLARQNISLLHAPLDLTVISDEGWERRQIALGTCSTETAEVNTAARAITTTLSNISNGVVSSSYSGQQELREAMMYDRVVVLAIVSNNDRNGVEIRLLSHRYSDDCASTRCFSCCPDQELKVGDLVFYGIAPLAGGAVRETIITIKPPRERTSVDPAEYVAVANMWSSYSALLTRIEAFFAALIRRGIDLKRVGFEPSLLGSSALGGEIVGIIDFNQGADA
jgi:hypothetical protein